MAGFLGFLSALTSGQGDVLKASDISQVASNFAQRSFFPKQTSVAALQPPTEPAPYWVAQLNPVGFIIISPDNREAPIIGFATDGHFNTEDRPDNVLRQLLKNREPGAATDARAGIQWACLLAHLRRDSASSPSQVSVPPLLSTHWSQWYPYNSECPAVTNALDGYAGRVPTGCVPVAMGQVLRYYSWPQAGTGTVSWTDTNGASQGSYSGDWRNDIDWCDMKDSYDFGCEDSDASRRPIPELMLLLGVSADMDYEALGSSSDIMVLGRSLGTHLGYSLGGITQAGTSAFGKILEQEIGARRPVFINLPFNLQGHTAVGDGLATDGDVHYVHVNFGFGGQSDAWLAYGDAQETNTFTAAVNTFHPNVSGALLACNPSYLEQIATNGVVADQTLTLINCGAGIGNYAVTSSEPWAQITPAANVPGSTVNVHTIKFDTADLTPGEHAATLLISGTAANLPRRVQVRIYRPDAPQIKTQPADIATLHPTNVYLEILALPGETHSPCSVSNPPQYQWYFNDQPLPGANNYWCQPVAYGSYQCAVTSLGGTVTSRVATVAVPAQGSQLSVASYTNGKIILRIENIQKGAATLQTSTDAKQWDDLKTFSITPGVIAQIQLTVYKDDLARFYRIKE
jgi:hypothetical protein